MSPRVPSSVSTAQVHSSSRTGRITTSSGSRSATASFAGLPRRVLVVGHVAAPRVRCRACLARGARRAPGDQDAGARAHAQRGCFDTGSGRYSVGTSRNPIDVADGGTVTWRPLTFICMEVLPSVRRSLLARWAGNRLAGGEDLAVDQDLAAAVNEAKVDLPGRHSWSLTVWRAGAAGRGAGRAARRCRAAQVSGQAAPIRAGAFDPVGAGNSVRP